jgi:hypothetical protein
MATRPISEEIIPLAAEDKFLIISVRDAKSLCPNIYDADILSGAIELAKPLTGDLIPLFDLRGLPVLYNDVQEFIDTVAGTGAHILVSPQTLQSLDAELLNKKYCGQIISAKGNAYKTKLFNLYDLRGCPEDSSDNILQRVADDVLLHINQNEVNIDDHGDDTLAEAPLPTLAEMETLLSAEVIKKTISRNLAGKLSGGVSSNDLARSFKLYVPKLYEVMSGERSLFNLSDDRSIIHYYLQSALIHGFLRNLHQNSLLAEYVITLAGDKVSCSPYHASGMHYAETKNDSTLLLGRPAVFAHRTNAVFSAEISSFERLINTSDVKESQLQKFLEAHPSFLRGLNYSNIYPQLVLERDDNTPLKPDFILEPLDDGWCDILDLKLPTQPIIVGRKDRATLAAGISEVISQLREYAAYFEQDKYRKWVKEKYGLRVYRPRLIAVVGRDMRTMEEAEIRRAMTAYENLHIMTFDQLANHAKNRLLI